MQPALQKAARILRHQDLDSCIGCARCADRHRRSQGRVASRSREPSHAASFNNERDITVPGASAASRLLRDRCPELSCPNNLGHVPSKF